MVSASFLVLRKKEPQLERPYKVKRYMAVGLIATVMAAIMVLLYLIPGSGCTLAPQEWAIAVGWVVLGVGMAMYSKRKYKNIFGKTD